MKYFKIIKSGIITIIFTWFLSCINNNTTAISDNSQKIDFKMPVACICSQLSLYAYEDSLNYKLIISVHDSIINGYEERNVDITSDGVTLKIEQYSITPFNGADCTDIPTINPDNKILNEYHAISGKIYISFKKSNLTIDTISYGEFIDTINIQINQVQLINNETDSSFILSDQDFIKLTNWGCAG
jgi:hypothetical protein